MGRICCESAATPPATRVAIAALCGELNVHPKTVAKQRKRSSVEGLKAGAKEPHSSAPSVAEEAVAVALTSTSAISRLQTRTDSSSIPSARRRG